MDMLQLKKIPVLRYTDLHDDCSRYGIRIAKGTNKSNAENITLKHGHSVREQRGTICKNYLIYEIP